MSYFVKPSGEKRMTLDGARAVALRNSKSNVLVEYTIWDGIEPMLGWRDGKERVLPYSRLNPKFAAELDASKGGKVIHRVGNARVNTTLYCPKGRYVMRIKTK